MRERGLPLVRAIPTWAWLAGIVVCSAAIRYVLARGVVAPWIMVDELIYSELAKSFAAGAQFTIRDQPAAFYGWVYPIVISPAWALFSAVPRAYVAAKAIDSLVMSSAAIPAYLLARRVLQYPLALVAAVLTVAVPSMVYTSVLMTENAFYPLFLWAVLALVLCLERPTLTRQAVLLALCGLGYATRAQAIALVPAVVTAPLLLAFFGRRPLRSLLAYRLLGGVVGGGAVLAAVFQLARGRSIFDLLGAYSVTGTQHYSIFTVAKWLLWHVAELDLYVAVFPFASMLLLALIARRLPREAQAFVAASVAVTLWLLVEVAAFASLPSVERIEERNTFYVAPLFLIALLLWLELDAPRPRRTALAVALMAGLLPAAIPYTRFIGLASTADTLALAPWWRVQDHLIALGQVRWVVAAATLAAAALWLLFSRRAAAVLPALVAASFLAVQAPAFAGLHGFRHASLNALFAGIPGPRPDWIDRAVGQDGGVAAVWTGKLDWNSVWQNEFFNRSVGTVYYTTQPLPGGLPQTQLHFDPHGFLRDPEGRKVHARAVFVDGSLSLNAPIVTTQAHSGIALYRLDGRPLRSLTHVIGVYPDTWSQPQVRYTRVACRGGSLTVQLQSDPNLFRRPQTVTIRTGNRTLRQTLRPDEAPRTVTVPLVVQGGTCDVLFTVRPTRIPGPEDDRRLGLHFTGFSYTPPG